MTDNVSGRSLRDGLGSTDAPEPHSGLGPTGAIPSAGCAECERLREEIADYMGHRTDNVAGKVWAARLLLSAFEDDLEDLVGEFESIGHDDYDQSLEIYGAPDELRLGEAAQRLIRDAGFHKVYVNHARSKGEADEGRWQTHYTLGDELPVRGWRRRYVADTSVGTTRVIAGPEENGYYEISYWPEGWNSPRSLADLEGGYYRIVPDPLDPLRDSDATRQGGDADAAPVPKHSQARAEGIAKEES